MHWQLSLGFVVYIILLPHSYVPISVIDFDNMYTLRSWYFTHTIKVGLLFLGATGLLMDYGAPFHLLLLWLTALLLIGGNYISPSDHMDLIHWTYRT